MLLGGGRLDWQVINIAFPVRYGQTVAEVT